MVSAIKKFVRKASKPVRKYGSGAKKGLVMKGSKPRKVVYSKKQNIVSYAKKGLDGLTFSKCVHYHPPGKRMSMMKKVSAPQTYITNLGYRCVAGEGKQFATGNTIGSSAVLRTILQNLTPSVGATGGNGATTVWGAFIEEINSEMLLTNSSQACAIVDIYDIVQKRDANENNTDTQQPWYAWQNGMAAQPAIGGSVPDFGCPGSIPTDSRLFNDYFRITKRTHLTLEQGKTHRHLIKSNVNRYVDTALLGAYTGAPSGGLAGFITYAMIVVNGTPAALLDGEGGYVNTSQAPVCVDVVAKMRYKYSWVSANVFTSYTYQNLDIGQQPSIVNIGSGGIELANYVGDGKPA